METRRPRHNSMSLLQCPACFPLYPIRTAYPSYSDLSLFNRSDSSKDWPRVRKMELFIIHFFSSFCYMLCCKSIFFSPLSEAWSIRAYSKPKLMGISVLFYTRVPELTQKELHVKKVSITFQKHCPKRNAGEIVLQLEV